MKVQDGVRFLDPDENLLLYVRSLHARMLLGPQQSELFGGLPNMQ